MLISPEIILFKKKANTLKFSLPLVSCLKAHCVELRQGVGVGVGVGVRDLHIPPQGNPLPAQFKPRCHQE